ncbi:MAG: hypothetical protein GX813_05050 [Erysipelotrichia bacterium]|jgi:hypothetical protein|nr:hypothetical protein [Erysipelotrichia bacterium]
MGKVGMHWWNDESIPLVEIEGKTYALSGWNGEVYWKSWECLGEYKMDAGEEVAIKPVLSETGEESYIIL